jgi:hypothetical protein
MSGNPNVNPSDPSKFRQQYLSNLALEAKNNDFNLQANKVFKKTGETPTQVLDSRTTSEKLADIQRLKIDLRSSLTQIADGVQADAIVQQLSPDSLKFLAQHIDEIITEIKPKYKYGILADVFIPYLDSYMYKAITTNEVISGLQQTSGRNVKLGTTQVLNDLVKPELLTLIIEKLNRDGSILNAGLEQAIRKNVEILKSILPTREDIQGLQQINNSNIQQLIQEELNDALQNIPTNTQISIILRELDLGFIKRDKIYAEQIAYQLHNLLSIEPAIQEQLLNIANRVHEYLKEMEVPVASPSKLVSNITQEEADKLNELYKPSSKINFITKDPSIEYIVRMMGAIPSSERPKFKQLGLTQGLKKQNVSLASLKEAVIRLNQKVAILLGLDTTQIETMGGFGLMKGRGITLKNIKENTDYSNAIMPVDKFVPFGRFHIDKYKLNDNILSLKRHTGCNVSGLPVERISSELGGVLRDIVGGGQPQYHQLEKLSPTEKLYLHKIAKQSNIIERLSIPSPNKDDDEKDINEFEIMKGEIMNGNDSTELVKKFKILILKMMKKDLLPKGQAKDLLLDLVSIGY